MNFKNLAVGSVTSGLLVFLIVTGFREEARDEQIALAAAQHSAPGHNAVRLAGADVTEPTFPDQPVTAIASAKVAGGGSAAYAIRAVNLTALAPARVFTHQASMATSHAEASRAELRPTQ